MKGESARRHDQGHKDVERYANSAARGRFETIFIIIGTLGKAHIAPCCYLAQHISTRNLGVMLSVAKSK
jgi:hypothetical protein